MLYGVDYISVVRFLYIATGAKDGVVRNLHTLQSKIILDGRVFFEVLLCVGAPMREMSLHRHIG